MNFERKEHAVSTFWEGRWRIEDRPWGRIRGEPMELITTMLPRESVRLDAAQLELLYTRLGEDEADNVLCRAMEEMAIRIKKSEKFYNAGATHELKKTVRSLVTIADQVGLKTLSRVSNDVITCIEINDWVALGATFSRLLRSSDQSLTAIWDLQDVTV